MGAAAGLMMSVVVFTAACTGSGVPREGRTDAGDVAVGRQCSASTYATPPPDPPKADGPLPADFEVSELRECRTSPGVGYPGEGEWLAVEERRAIGGRLAALVRELRRRGTPTAGGNACLAYADLVPDAVVVGADGAVFRPAFPRDTCGHIAAAVKRAYEQLEFTTVATRRVRQMSSQLAAATGCPDERKDLIALGDPNRRSFSPRPPGSRTPGIDRICIYQTTEQQRWVGTLVTGRRLDAAESNALRPRFDGRPAPQACATPHYRVAVVETGVVHLWVELDGCQRVMTGGWGWSAGGPALADAVERAATGRTRPGRGCAPPLFRADVDGDGRPDAVSHSVDSSRGGFVTAVCLGTGERPEALDVGAENFELVDVGDDGRAEIFAGGTSVNAGGMGVYTVSGNAIVSVRSGPKPLTVRWGRELGDLASGEVASYAEWGCEDVTGDRRRELVQVVVDYAADIRRSTAYRITGGQASVVSDETLPIPQDARHADSSKRLVAECTAVK